jgi:hypothetical protein
MQVLKSISMVILVLSMYSCSFPVYVAKDSSNDKVIYIYSEGKSVHNLNDIDIYRLGNKEGKLSFAGRMVIFISLNGGKAELYKEHQYSGVDKITQSFDDKIIRVYYWQSSFTRQYRIAVLDLDKFTVKTYRIKEK